MGGVGADHGKDERRIEEGKEQPQNEHVVNIHFLFH